MMIFPATGAPWVEKTWSPPRKRPPKVAKGSSKGILIPRVVYQTEVAIRSSTFCHIYHGSNGRGQCHHEYLWKLTDSNIELLMSSLDSWDKPNFQTQKNHERHQVQFIMITFLAPTIHGWSQSILDDHGEPTELVDCCDHHGTWMLTIRGPRCAMAACCSIPVKLQLGQSLGGRFRSGCNQVGNQPLPRPRTWPCFVGKAGLLRVTGSAAMGVTGSDAMGILSNC